MSLRIPQTRTKREPWESYVRPIPLEQGVDAWNAWREENWQENPSVDLREAYLQGAQLQRADLRGSDLTRATLCDSDLRRANLDGAQLAQANLHGANLSEAILSGARLINAILEKANLTNAHLGHVETEETNFCEAKLEGADLKYAHLVLANLSGARLVRADLSEADASGANFSDANLTKARFGWTRLTYSKFKCAVLKNANLTQTILNGADLSGADLSGANLERALLIDTNLDGATLTNCSIHGFSVWNIQGTPKDQTDLIIVRAGEPAVTVDDIELAQFVYLLLNNKKIRDVIDTITSKVVLILGRSAPKRKVVLDALREELRKRDYVPVLFDFTKPRNQTTLEAVSTLAHMARFVVADLTDAKSVLQELQAVVPINPSVPVQPLLLAAQEEPGMFDFFRRFPWVLKPHSYKSAKRLIADLGAGVIAPAEAKVRELRG